MYQKLSIFIALLALVLVSCISTKKVVVDPNPLDGTWIPVQQTMAGKPIPAALFAKQKLIIGDTNYTFIAESIDKGIIKVHSNRMDIYGKEGVNAGNHITAIHKFEGDQLWICYNLGGEDYPATYETTGHPVYFLSVYKKLSTSH